VDENEILEEAAKPSDLSGQVGYSKRQESNSLRALENSCIIEGASSSRSKRFMLVEFLKTKFFATTKHLPPQPIVEQLVHVFFIEANSHVGVLDRYFFHQAEVSWNSTRDELAANFKLEGLPRDFLYFPAVLFQVLAISLQYVTLELPVLREMGLEDYAAVDDLSQKYTQHGMDLMKILGRHNPTVMSVQHDLMRAFWLKNCSSGTESWYILGDAIRQAQDLGLHLQRDVVEAENVKKTLENMWYEEWKKRLWMSLFNWDAHMAMVLGRPRSINASDCTVDPPLDCDMPDSPPTTVPTNTALNRVPSSYTKHIFNNFVGHKTHEMLSVGANRRYVKDYGVVRRLQDDVLNKLKELPPTARPNNPDTSWDSKYPYLSLQREHILSFAYSFLVALHRPHAGVHEESSRMAMSCALATLESQQRLFERLPRSHYRSFGMSFYTIDAALFISTAILERPSTDMALLNRVRTALTAAITRLNIIKARSPMAETGAKALERCYERIEAQCLPSADRGFTPQETPSLGSEITPASTNSSRTAENPISPDYADFENAFPANGDNIPLDFDFIGNFTDFNASFFTDQMSSILNSNTGSAEDDVSLWQALMT
jgi:hypothetical protein